MQLWYHAWLCNCFCLKWTMRWIEIIPDSSQIRMGDGSSKTVSERYHFGIQMSVHRCRPNFTIMPTSVFQSRFKWSSKKRMGTTFVYSCEKYTTNVKTNLSTHYEPRIKRLLKMWCHQWNAELAENVEMRRYDDIDVNAAMKYFCKNEDWADNVVLSCTVWFKLSLI